MENITSVQNPKVKAYKELVSSAKSRREQGRFVLEGLRLCLDVLRSGCEVLELYYTKVLFDNNKAEIEELIKVSKEVYEISENVAEKMSDTKTAQGVFCVVERKTSDSNLLPSGKYILLENIQDPANIGAVSRTAEALGISGLIVSGGCDVLSPKALRASMGALLRIPVIETEDVMMTIVSAQKKGIKTYASTPREDATDVTKVDFSGGVIVVIGNEANGVTQSTFSCCGNSITIKMTGRAESLNAGAAASIIMWEMVKPINEKS
ncbi:MAG: RNA methyltransferase [Oscillospiraceae bacterium]|nr:RNA methyltransferase [Candidatus Limimonas coprohippi]MCQ2487886.1 RNA methyltransferase [Clostridia bacterium]